MIDLPNITTIELPGSFNDLREYTVIQSPGFEEFFNIVPTTPINSCHLSFNTLIWLAQEIDVLAKSPCAFAVACIT